MAVIRRLDVNDGIHTNVGQPGASRSGRGRVSPIIGYFIHGGVVFSSSGTENLKSLLDHRVETAPDLGGKPEICREASTRTVDVGPAYAARAGL
jgi:hypothetical protein